MPALEVRTSRYPKQALPAQHYQELLQSHCVPDYLRLFKEISCKERQQKNSGKKAEPYGQGLLRDRRKAAE